MESLQSIYLLTQGSVEWPCQSPRQTGHPYCHIQHNTINRKSHTWLHVTGHSQIEDTPIITFKKWCLWNTNFMLQSHSKDYYISTNTPKWKLKIWNPKYFGSQAFCKRDIQPLLKGNYSKNLWNTATLSRTISYQLKNSSNSHLQNMTVIFIDRTVDVFWRVTVPKSTLCKMKEGTVLAQ